MTIDAEKLRLVLGLKLKSMRQERQMSLTDLARGSGVSVSYLSEIEKGRKYPKPDKLLRLATALGIAFDDLVSQSVRPDLDPIKVALGSRFLGEFPFRLFGLEPGDVLDLVTDDTAKATALFRTLLEVGQLYDLHIEQFLFAALRSYQEMHGNYFDELERHASDFRSELGLRAGQPATADRLRELLERDHGYVVDESTLQREPGLRRFRWVFVDSTRPSFFVNGNLLPVQRAFVYAYELGYLRMGLPRRTFQASTWLRVDSFEQVLANFQASYFAGAVIIEREALVDGLRELFASDRWNVDEAQRLRQRFEATPEMFGYRMTQLMPHALGLKDLFFLRLNHDRETDEYQLAKVLNLSRHPLPFLAGAGEHHCRRWPSFRLLGVPLSARNEMVPQTTLYRCRFLTDDSEHLVLSMARPLVLTGSADSAVSIGFRLTPPSRRRIAFHADPDIPCIDVDSTCERCPLPADECADRVVPPAVHEAQRRADARAELLEEFIERHRERAG